MANKLISSFLLLNGSGSEDMTAAQGEYRYTATGDSAYISRMMVIGSINGSLSANGYVGASALTNGLRVFTTDADGNEDVILTPEAVTRSAGWAQYCYDVAPLEFGAGDNSIIVRWTFARSGVFLQLDEGESLVMEVNDSLAGLTRHTAIVQGFLGSASPRLRSNA